MQTHLRTLSAKPSQLLSRLQWIKETTCFGDIWALLFQNMIYNALPLLVFLLMCSNGKCLETSTIYNLKCLILAVIPLSTGYDVADLFRVTIEKTISLFGWLSGQLHGATKRQGLSHCVRVYMGLTVASPRWKPKLAVTFRARRIRRIHFRRPPVLTDFKLKFPVEPAPANCHHHCHASKIQKGPISSHWHHHASPPFYLQHIGICLPVNTYFLLYNYNT